VEAEAGATAAPLVALMVVATVLVKVVATVWARAPAAMVELLRRYLPCWLTWMFRSLGCLVAEVLSLEWRRQERRESRPP
jgi:hypothetical protein